MNETIPTIPPIAWSEIEFAGVKAKTNTLPFPEFLITIEDFISKKNVKNLINAKRETPGYIG